MAWSKEIIDKINKSTTIQNQPYDNTYQPFQDNPLWAVTLNDQVYLRAGKGKESKWY